MNHSNLLFALLCFLPFSLFAQTSILEPIDVFDLEYISDPQLSADGSQVVFVRNFKDIMTDGNRSNLWITDFAGTNMRPLTTGMRSDGSPRWSPNGKQLVYRSNQEGSSQLYLRMLDSGAERRLSNLQKGAGNIQWSPDGKWISFTMKVDATPPSLAKLPKKPKGAKWTTPPKYIDDMKFKADGAGFLTPGFTQIFVISADGGHVRQLTSGDYNHANYSWAPDSESIVFSARRGDNWEYEAKNSDIYELVIASGKLTQLTKRNGPDTNPIISPDGKYIAYTGHDDKLLGYQNNFLYLMNRDGSNSKNISKDLDRSVAGIKWDADGEGIYFQYDDKGDTHIVRTDLSGKRTKIASNVGGLSLGRPYSGGVFAVAKNDNIAFTLGTTEHPADLAVVNAGSPPRRLTKVNEDLFSHKKIGQVEEMWVKSSYDQQAIQSWICYPPNFDPTKKYPLILEIHGGPFANYGDRFSAEVQMFAAAGYIVVYSNPRGSSSYGEDFGNLIHHNYPNQDYDDLMSVVDGVIAKGNVDTKNLFVTGGSGGGVLTAWIVGKTDRFRAAVVAKPVINWYSFVLHADNPAFFYKYWFPGLPWEHTEHYMKRSPISLVGNVTTPTMLLTGEQDYRTPMSETEQYYTALKLNKVESALVRIQNAGHGIANKPSNLMNKVVYILAWFDKYKK